MSQNRKPRIFYGYIIVAIAFVIMAIMVGGNNSFGVFLGPVLDEFGWTRASISGAFSLSMLVCGILSIVTGRITDRIGPRLLLIVCAVFSGVGYLLMPLVHSPWQLYFFFGILTGIGLSGPIVPLLSTVARWFTKRRAMMSGIISAGTSVGIIILSQMAGGLIVSRGWRFAFMVLGIITIVIVITLAQFLKRDPHSMGLLPDGAAEVTREAAKLPTGGLSLREAVITRQFWIFFMVYLFLGFSIFTIVAHIVIYASGLGIPRASAISLLSVLSISNTASRLTMGSVADKIGTRRTVTINISLMSAAFIWLLFSQELWMLIVFAAVFGFTWGGSFVPMSPIIAELFGLKAHGLILGITNFSITIGSSVGPILAGYIFDVRKSYQLDFILLTAAAVSALVLMLFLRPAKVAEKG